MRYFTLILITLEAVFYKGTLNNSVMSMLPTLDYSVIFTE